MICFGQGNVSRSNLCHVGAQALGASVPNEGCAISLGLRLKAAWDGAVVELRVTCDIKENDILMVVSAYDVGVVCYCSKSYLRLIDTQSQLKEFPDHQIS